MMATYVKAPRSLPSFKRSARITQVAAGDQIDIEDVLGRPARGIKLVMTASTDTAEFKLNNLVRMYESQDDGTVGEQILVWNSGTAYDTYSVTGQTEHETQGGLLVSSIEIVSLTLSSGSVIEIVVW